MVDFTVMKRDSNHFVQDAHLYPAEFVRELAIAALRKAPAVSWEDAVSGIGHYLESGGQRESKDNGS
jgi:hypothetical protein